MLIKGIGVTNENEANEQKGGFIPIILGTLTASLLGSVLTGIIIIIIRSNKTRWRSNKSRRKFLILPYHLTNF